MEQEKLNKRLKDKNLLAQWHSDNFKNKNSFNLDEKAKWICQNGHVWEAKISNRLYLNRGCPYCAGCLCHKNNNLKVKRPDLLKYWNYNKNNLSPLEILPSSVNKVWWMCEKGHEWMSSPHSMGNVKTKNGCPYCKGLISSKDNNILEEGILKEWDYEKNSILPEEMTRGKGKKVFWKCEYGHEWSATVPSRLNGSGCPFCNKKHSDMEIRVFCETSKIYKDAIWHYKDNRNEIDVFLPSINCGIEIDGGYWHKDKVDADKKKNKYFFKKGINIIRLREYPLDKISNCDILYKNYQFHKETLNSLFKYILNFDCYNSEIKEYLNDSKYLNPIKYQKYRNSILAFQSPIAKTHPYLKSEWDYDKNGCINPDNISHGSGRKVWWKCENGHEWESVIKNRCNMNGCPYCNKHKISKDYNLLVKFPDILNFWDYEKNFKKPEELSPFSHQKAWFIVNYQSKFISVSDFVRRFK